MWILFQFGHVLLKEKKQKTNSKSIFTFTSDSEGHYFPKGFAGLGNTKYIQCSTVSEEKQDFCTSNWEDHSEWCFVIIKKKLRLI